MYLWICWYTHDEWACYIIAPTIGRAKSLFHDYWSGTVYDEYTDIRAKKLRAADGYQEAVLDMDCAELEALGVRYLTEEEMEDLY